MAQIVIAFADSDECGDHVVVGSVLVIERRLTEPARERTSITEVPPVAFRELSRPERPYTSTVPGSSSHCMGMAAVDQTTDFKLDAECS